jgi:putative cell wall-binding protein/chitodextrinase
VTVTDELTEQPLVGATVLYIAPDGGRRSLATSAQGSVLLEGLPDGEHTLYAVAQGYRPRAATATVAEGLGQLTIALEPGLLGTADLVTTRLTAEEAAAAGIDLDDPENATVIEFEINLANQVWSAPITVEGYWVDGRFHGVTFSGAGGTGGTCTSSSCSFVDRGHRIWIAPHTIPSQPSIVVLVVPAEGRMLKEFFDVQMNVVNLSDAPFAFDHGSATLELEPGLSLPALFGSMQPGSIAQAAPITAADPGVFSWIVRGDTTGVHPLRAVYSGSLEPFGDAVEIVAEGELRVWGADALGLTVSVPTQLHTGYEFPIQLSLRNLSDRPVEVPVDGEDGEPVFDPTDLYNVELRLKASYGDQWRMAPVAERDDPREPLRAAVLEPGESLDATFWFISDVESYSTTDCMEDLSFISRAVAGDARVHPDLDRVVCDPELDGASPEDSPVLRGAEFRGRAQLSWDPVPDAIRYELYSGLTATILEQGYQEVTPTVIVDADTHALGRDASLPPGHTYALVTVLPDETRMLHNELTPGPVPSVSVEWIADAVEGDPEPGEPGTPGVFRVTRTGLLDAPLPVTYELGGTAEPGTDYLAVGDITIPVDEWSVDVEIIPVDDDVVQLEPRTVTFTVLEPADDSYEPDEEPTATVHIIDDDMDVSLSVIEPAAFEGGEPAVLTLTRSGSLVGDLPVEIEVELGTAEATDYTLLDVVTEDEVTTVTIPDGQAAVPFRVAAVDDDIAKGDRTLTVHVVENRPAYGTAEPTSGEVTLVDDDAVVTLTALADVAAETLAAETARPVRLRIERTESAVHLPIEVTLALAEGSVASTDDVVLPAAIEIPAGETSQDVIIDVVNDELVEGDELLRLVLDTVSGDGLGHVTTDSTPVEVTILDNDVAVGVMLAEGFDGTVEEAGDTPISLTFTRRGALHMPLTVEVALTEGDGYADADDVDLPDTIVISAGESALTVHMDVIDDDLDEGDEILELRVTGASGAGVNHVVVDGEPAVVTIIDDDDHTPPAWAPDVTLTVTDVTADGATVTWSDAATDRYGVVGYRVHATNIATPVATAEGADATSAVVTGLASGRTYTLTVKAVDAAGNVSLQGNPQAQVTTLDVIDPGWPTEAALTRSAATATTLTLTWPEATDNAGIAGYRVFVKGTEDAVVGGAVTQHVVTGLSPETAYDFAVEAFDAAGNRTPRLEARLSTTADETAPTWPGAAALTFASPAQPNQLSFSWPAAGDDVGVTGYRIQRGDDGVFVTLDEVLPSTLSFTDSGLESGVVYTYRVIALDAAENASTPLEGSRQTADNVPPTWVDGTLTATSITSSSARLTWSGATDNVAVTGYRILNGAQVLKTVSGGATLTDVVSGLSPSTTYTLTVQAVDAAGNVSTGGPTVTFDTDAAPAGGGGGGGGGEPESPAGDTEAPTWPSGSKLVPSRVTDTTLRLAWNAATDDVGVTGYRVFRGGAQIGETSAAIRVIDVAGLTPATGYSFRVQAVDAAGNVSTGGPSVSVTTMPAQDGGGLVHVDERQVSGDGTGTVETVFTIPVGPVSITLANLSGDGTLTVEQRSGSPTQETPGLTLLGTFYEVTIVGASFNRATVCFTYDPDEVEAAGLEESQLRLFHHGPVPYPNGPERWSDITSSLDTRTRTVCGITSSFSPFAIGVADDEEPAPTPAPQPPSEPAPQPPSVPVPDAVERLAGAGRIETAVAISAARFAPGVPVAFIATAGDFPDALAGGPAAAQLGGPILLTVGEQLPAATTAELQRLQPGRIVVLGGRGAVPEAVEERLAELTAGAVQRLSGPNRYDTAAAIAEAAFQPGVPIAFIATGSNFPDALAGGAVAAELGGPVLLTDPAGLPAATRAVLERLQAQRIVVLGGTSAVSDAVLDELRSLSGDVTRVAGPDRFATAAAVAAMAFPDHVDAVYVATGGNFPDALAGVPAAAVDGAPLLLVTPDSVPTATAERMAVLQPRRIVVLGGAAAVDTPTVQSLTEHLRR